MAEIVAMPTVDGGFAAHVAAERAADEWRLAAQRAEGLMTPAQEFTITAGPLNDTAEFHVYGSRGRTYYALDGSGDVIADADHVIPSRADQIRRDESLHPDPQVRARYAISYMRSIEGLTRNDGLELYQAERIADARLADRREIFKLTGKFMDGEEKGGRFDPTNGKRTPDNAEMKGDKARRRALDLYQRKDAARVRAARLENPNTCADEQARIAAEAAQYRGNRDEMLQEAARRRQSKDFGHKLGQELGKKRKEDSPKPQAVREVAEVNPQAEDAEIQRLQGVLAQARNDYARRVAGNSRRAVHRLANRDFRRSGVEDARIAYERARDQLGGIIGHLYQQAGASDSDLDTMAWSGAGQESQALVEEIRQEKLIATGENRYTRSRNADGTVTAVPVEHGSVYNAIHYPANAFYRFYARNSIPASRGRRVWQATKKTAVVGAIGTGAGLTAGLLAGAALSAGAGVAGVVIANRLTKAYMGSRARRVASGDELLVGIRSEQLQNQINSSLRDHPEPNDRNELNTANLTDFTEAQRKREVMWNRIRLGAMAVGLALGGYGVEHLVTHGETENLWNGSGSSTEPRTGGDGYMSEILHLHPVVPITPSAVSPSELPNVDLHGAEYPWDWAAQKFGQNNATTELLKLVNRARNAGVDVETNPLPDGKFDISVNGITNTKYVVRALNATKA